ncbi:MAG: TlpA family protein disulfide reductase [Anaerolineaceae bacterium]|nr:TlpA family protein disulfide reductase [Anaerolineaceae bacterium]
MRKILILSLALMLIFLFGNINVFAYSESELAGKSLMDIFNGDEQQACVIGDELSCEIPLIPFEAPSFLEPGAPVVFHTTDVEGNPINSADLFSGHKVTLIKIWSTTCPHCIKEMPDMMKLNDEFMPQGAQVIGIVYDADEADEVLEAEEIINDLDLDFVNLLPNQAIWQMFRTQSFPSTFFVNDKGVILGEPVMGSRFSKYEELLNQYLSL